MRYLFLKDSISLQSNYKNSKSYFYYLIADSIYQSDTKLHELEHLRQAHVNHQSICKSINGHSNQTCLNKLTYGKNTQIGEKNYQLKVSSGSDSYSSSHYQIEANSDTYKINKDSIRTSASNLANLDITILMGPAMLVNLAINNVFCVHASAFKINSTLFILMAESGTGKSTIAKYMNQQQNSLRIADDIVPLKIHNQKLTLLSRFPQLKLSQEQQYSGDDICTETILLFANKSETETTIKPTDTFESMKKLIQHSVATRLFAENELNNHLKFCHKTSLQTTAYKLNYQHSNNSLKQLSQWFYEII